MQQKTLVFEGYDSTSNLGLWVTDGTAAGTYELAIISDAGPGGGFYPSYNMVVLNNDVLFEGVDATGNRGLWVSDGTAAGTHELTGIVGASSNGLFSNVTNPHGIVAFNESVLFQGTDASGKDGLWVTDGTAADTHELTGIVGANPLYGIAPIDLTVFNGQVLFEGQNSNYQMGLWVTDGTAAGTHELTGIVGASIYGLYPSDLTVFNGQVLFKGLTTISGLTDLWVTDGTAAGTHELTGIVGANSQSGYGLSPTDMTVFNGEVLFEGLNTSGQAGLWVTNGTAAGTHELTGISGANSRGLQPTDMTVFNGMVLFQGLDTSGDAGLWVTDGTAAGTHELTGIVGANFQYGLYPSDLTVFNGEVLFKGLDTSGDAGLWVTDGTTAGTHELTGISGASVYGLNPSIGALLTTDTNPPTGYNPIVVPGGRITTNDFAVPSTWGSINPNAPAEYFSNYLTHPAVDIEAKLGTEVDAFASGTVVESSYSKALGYYVLVYDPGALAPSVTENIGGNKDFYTLYLHLENQPQVSNGDTIFAGEKLGEVGTTGNETGVPPGFGLLHFEIRLFSGLYQPFDGWDLPTSPTPSSNIYIYMANKPPLHC